MSVLVLAGACAAAVVGIAGGQEDERLADFAWSVPSRFGHDVDGDGLLDYANSAGEVVTGPWPVRFALRDEACAPGVERDWSVGGEAVAAERDRGACAFRLEFEDEGAYDVELHVHGAGRDARSSQRVIVQDLLIVSIGDSVASGEGNPDNRSAIRPRWQSTRCHRSAFAGSARTAEIIEDADERSSVSFLHLGCSGATVPRGLTGGYAGIERPPFARPRKLRPQVEELEEVAAGREIDAVILSIGANDVGFARIVTACIFLEECDRKRVDPKLVELPSGRKERLDDLMRRALAQLGDRYDALESRLPAGLARERLYAVEYFDPTHSAPGRTCDRILGGVERGELEWAYSRVLVPLNEELHRASDRHRWRYVGGVAAAFADHGYCVEGDRWVRRLKESFAGQGRSHQGTLHPTEAGHLATAELIAAPMRAALFPDGAVREPRPPEASEERVEGIVPADAAESADDEARGASWLLWAGIAAAAAILVFAGWLVRGRGAG
jgi:hypothetical protein